MVKGSRKEHTNCKGCNAVLTEKEKNKSSSRSWCANCARENRRTYDSTPEAREARKRHRAFSVNSKQKNNSLFKKYGITVKDRQRMIQEEQGLCPICRRKVPDNRWAIDHCHKTGAVRGVICNVCNLGLGSFKDSVGSLLRAVSYLSRHYLSNNPGVFTEGVTKPDEEWEGEAE